MNHLENTGAEAVSPSRAQTRIAAGSLGSSFALGIVFAVGLGLSGMTNPLKVLGFLDVFGAWDPSLAFVMGGAVTTYFVVSRIVFRQSKPLISTSFDLPKERAITGSLVVGAAIFGVGWGLEGFCPGPAIVSLAGLFGTHRDAGVSALVFSVFMVIGVGLFEIARRSRGR
jgi:uncharacterized membrane protein YedE/YeeE